MIIHRIHNSTTAVITSEVANSEISAAALGVMAFILCQRGNVSPEDIAKRFDLAADEIDMIVGELAARDLVEVMERIA